MITTQVILTLFLLPAFFAMAYQEDVVRLATASRVALEPIVVESLVFIHYVVMESLVFIIYVVMQSNALIYYIVMLFRFWFEDWYAERSARAYLASLNDTECPNGLEDSSDSEDNDSLNITCVSCHRRQAVSWLGDTECSECNSEH